MTDAPTPEGPSSAKPVLTRWWMIVVYVIVGLIILAALLSDDEEGAQSTTVETAATTTVPVSSTTTRASTATEAPTTTSAPVATTTVSPTTTLPPTTTPQAPPRVPAFGSGILEVGVDFSAGTYETGIIGEDDFLDSCYWERLAGFSGEFEDIIANMNPTVHSIVEIKDSDVGFSSDCGDWFEIEPLAGPLELIPAGSWAVGIHIEAGTYEAPGGEACYWERLSGFSGELDDTITNDLPSGPAIVEISASDAGFNSTGCGDWSLR